MEEKLVLFIEIKQLKARGLNPSQIARQLKISRPTVYEYLSIENTLTYTLSNGVVEGMNNKIKTIKRSGFGYRNFEHLRARVILSQKLLARSNKPICPLYFSDEVTAA